MSDYEKFAKNGLDKLGFGLILYGYAIMLGACYILAFWRPYGFNIFPYLSLIDYVGAPLNRLSVLIIFPSILVASFYVLSIFAEVDLVYWLRCLLLCFLYSACYSVFTVIKIFLKADFAFSNEGTIVISVISFSAISLFCIIYSFVLNGASNHKEIILILGIAIAQISVSLSAGYEDGKAIFMGASRVLFLENKELCDKNDPRDWVYLSVFGGQTFFMNTIDKRICITDQKNLRLISRDLQHLRNKVK